MLYMMTWPPETLTIQTEDLINQCELMEVHPSFAEGKQYLPVVEIAALLYIGDYAHARHAWRRWKHSQASSFLQDWWSVGAAMMALFSGNKDDNTIEEFGATIWQGLSNIQKNHPSPINKYATEVGIAYRKRILNLSPKRPNAYPYCTLLNFTSTEEWEQFCRDHNYSHGSSRQSNNTTSLALDSRSRVTHLVAFLESKPPSGNAIVPGSVRT